MSAIKLGTCSWKYDSWRGLVYPEKKQINYLEEYSKQLNTVEIDQWFWSLFPNDKVLLPDNNLVEEYSKSVGEDFRFTIKLPNAISLTHHYQKSKTEPLLSNKYFLSAELFNKTIEILSSFGKKLGCVMLQFEYLNKLKMPDQNTFLNKLKIFADEIDTNNIPVAIEIRNPNYLNEKYFAAMDELGFFHVFLEGYFMPSTIETYQKYQKHIKGICVFRLHGPDRKEIEKVSNEQWNKIYINRDEQVKKLAELFSEIRKKDVDIYVNVNNHFEGSAPLTIKKIKELL